MAPLVRPVDEISTSMMDRQLGAGRRAPSRSSSTREAEREQVRPQWPDEREDALMEAAGSMTPEQRQEEISKAYLHAVAAHCGYAVGSWSQDHGGLDATIGAARPVGSGYLAKPKVDVQLKATHRREVEHHDFISWQLEGPHYDGLVAQATAPHLLVILLLPSDVDQAIEHTVNHILIRRCAYWVTMTGMPARSVADPTVRLPKSQQFSPAALRGIMEQISRGNRP